jgi:hypothetical protein
MSAGQKGLNKGKKMLNEVKSRSKSGKTKIFIFLICNLLICNLQFSQSINLTLGSGGVFTLKDASTSYFTLSQSTGNLTLNQSMVFPVTTSSNTGIIFKGTDRFLHNFGTNNTFLGVNSGNFTMTGVSNTAVGNLTLYSNTTGSYNIAIGGAALQLNTTGSGNTALGLGCLLLNTAGNYNTAIGGYSLLRNSFGTQNTALGYESLSYNNNGSGNSAIGFQSLNSNTAGINNTAVGNQSLFSNITGNYNTALGYQSNYSGIYTTFNTSTGYQSLFYNVGSFNTAIGYQSLFSNSDGENSTAIGFRTLYNNNIGLGQNTAVGWNSGSNVISGVNNTFIGYSAQPLTSSSSNSITLGDNRINSLRCNITSITSLSDMRDKKNIKELSLGLDFITKLHPRQFNWDKREWYDDNISDGSKMKEAPTAGFIAQELDEAQTTAGADWLNLVLKDNPEKWEATYGNLLPVVVKAIQDLKSEKDNEIAELKSENEKLKKDIVGLETVNEKVARLEKLVDELTTFKNAALTENK